MHLKCAKINFPESVILPVGDIAKQQFQGLLGALHAAGEKPHRRQMVVQRPQLVNALLGQGQIRAAAIQMAEVCLGFAVANQVNGVHFSRCSNPQNTRLTRCARPERYWHS